MPATNLEQNNRLKKLAAIGSVGLAISLTLIKTVGVFYTGSLAVLSSMIDSLADLFASSVTFIAIRFSSRPASPDHRYGYGKAEALSALVQSAFVAGSGIFVMYDGINRFLHPRPLLATNMGIVVMSISLVATLILIIFQRYVAKHTNSQAIRADSAHYSVDVITNAAIIVTLVVVKLFNISWFDTLTAFLVSAYLLVNAYKLAKDAVKLLMDTELSDEIRNNIRTIVTANQHALGLHDLRTRDLGGVYIFEFHLELDGNLNLYQAHRYTEEVEDALLKVYPDAQIIIHQDPNGLHEKRLDHQIEGQCELK